MFQSVLELQTAIEKLPVPLVWSVTKWIFVISKKMVKPILIFTVFQASFKHVQDIKCNTIIFKVPLLLKWGNTHYNLIKCTCMIAITKIF